MASSSSVSLNQMSASLYGSGSFIFASGVVNPLVTSHKAATKFWDQILKGLQGAYIKFRAQGLRVCLEVIGLLVRTGVFRVGPFSKT